MMHPAYYRCKDIIDNYIRNIDLFIDIGVGFPYSEAWAVDCDIIGFEPNKLRFDSIVDLYPGNLYNVMVTANNGYMDGFECGKYTILFSDNNLYHDGDAYESKVYKSVSVDKIVKDYKSIFLWADAEGSELEILKGAIDSLTRKTIVGINLEVRNNNHFTKKYGWPTYEKIEEFLNQYDYVSVEEFNSDDHMDILFITKERNYDLQNMQQGF